MLDLLFSQKLLDNILVVSAISLKRGETPVCVAIEKEQAWEASKLLHCLGPDCPEGNWEVHGLFLSIDVDFDCLFNADVFIAEESFQHESANRLNDHFSQIKVDQLFVLLHLRLDLLQFLEYNFANKFIEQFKVLFLIDGLEVLFDWCLIFPILREDKWGASIVGKCSRDVVTFVDLFRILDKHAF